MKAFRLLSLVALFSTTVLLAAAQDVKTETIAVSGNCGMCKSTIEKAAKTAGVKEAKWDKEKKELTVKYNTTSTNAAKIQESIAAAGYDTRDVKAPDAVYEKLPACCHYDRVEKKDELTGTSAKAAACCTKESTVKTEAKHD